MLVVNLISMKVAMKKNFSSTLVVCLVISFLIVCSCGLPAGISQQFPQLKQIQGTGMPDLKGIEQTAAPDINKLQTMMPGIEKALTPQPAASLAPGESPVQIPPEFPVTPDAGNLNVTNVGGFVMVNYQTNLSLTDAMDYCQNHLAQAGFKLLPALLSTTDVTFSMVYAKPSGNKQVVIQGVSLGSLTNINVRYEQSQ